MICNWVGNGNIIHLGVKICQGSWILGKSNQLRPGRGDSTPTTSSAKLWLSFDRHLRWSDLVELQWILSEFDYAKIEDLKIKTENKNKIKIAFAIDLEIDFENEVEMPFVIVQSRYNLDAVGKIDHPLIDDLEEMDFRFGEWGKHRLLLQS